MIFHFFWLREHMDIQSVCVCSHQNVIIPIVILTECACLTNVPKVKFSLHFDGCVWMDRDGPPYARIFFVCVCVCVWAT